MIDLKFRADYFLDPKVILLSSKPEGSRLTLNWIKLLFHEAALDGDGILIEKNGKPSNADTLSHALEQPYRIMYKEINEYLNSGLLTIKKNTRGENVLFITDWGTKVRSEVKR